METRWEWIEELFAETLSLPEGERAAFLEVATRGDGAARAEVEALLEADGQSGDFLGGGELPLGDSPLPGSRIGAYEIVRELGRGGTGIVCLARRADQQFDKHVAIKLLRTGSPLLAMRFRVERQILARLEHPHIARLYDSGVSPEGAPYYVMEHVDGEPIDRYCDRHRLGLDQRLELVVRVAAAVEFAHRHLIVHRDIKPANILVGEDGHPKLLDFGIAKLLTPTAADASTTGQWIRVLTPNFASPEQISGQPATTSGDVYSLGVLLYLLLTGELPHHFEGRSLEQMERTLREAPLRRPSTTLATASDEVLAARGFASPREAERRLRGDLDNIVQKALAHEPERRYSSAAALADDLARRLAGQPIEARSAELGYRLGRLVRRHRWAAAASTLALLVILATTLALAFQSARLRTERNLAERERDRAAQLAEFLRHTLEGAGTRQDRGRDVSVREVLDRARERIGLELAGDPLSQADVMLALGRVYTRLGLARHGEPLVAAALDLRRQHLGARHAATAEVLAALAWLEVASGAIATAEQRFRESLEILESCQPGNARQSAEISAALGRLLRGSGRIREAEPWLRLALDRARQGWGEGQPQVAERLNDLGKTLSEIPGKSEEAENLHRRALTILRQHAAKHGALLKGNLRNLAVTLAEQQRWAEAEALLVEVEAMEQREHGDQALLRPRLLGWLADFAGYQGHHKRAITYRRQALAVARAQVSRGHPHERDLLLGLGRALLAAGEVVEARSALSEAVTIDRSVLPPGHSERAESEALLAAAERASG